MFSLTVPCTCDNGMELPPPGATAKTPPRPCQACAGTGAFDVTILDES